MIVRYGEAAPEPTGGIFDAPKWAAVTGLGVLAIGFAIYVLMRR